MLPLLPLVGALVAAYAPASPLIGELQRTRLQPPMMVASLEPPAVEDDEQNGPMDEAPLSAPARIKRALTFYGKVVPILAAYKAAEVRAEYTGASEAATEAVYEGLHDWGSDRLESAIQELKGFYVKTGQVISTRVDLFPEQYTSKLASLQDDLDPMPADQIKAVVVRELLQGDPLDSIFASFDDEPLGSASIAQVHAATLRDGRKVAVKVQRPNAEPKLRGDIANLKTFSQRLASALPVDYYTVFCELERALQGELDFLAEGQAAMKVHASVSHLADGTPAEPAVQVPLPIAGLSSRRVLVMDYVEGTPLNRLADKMAERGIKPGSPESILAGRRILTQLTEAFGRMMLGAGFIHGDPHPGNIFVQEGAKVALIDCGQVKQIPTDFRLRLAEAILLVNEWQETGGSPELIRLANEKMAGFGVTFLEDAKPEAAAALALLLFGDPDAPMPGGFSNAELSADSPIKAISSFPQELVLLGRATILIKGISKRLGIKWSLADKWKAMAEQALECGEDGCLMPTWSAQGTAATARASGGSSGSGGSGRPRFREVTSSIGSSGRLVGKWAKAKSIAVAGAVLPSPVKRLAIRIAANRVAKAD